MSTSEPTGWRTDVVIVIESTNNTTVLESLGSLGCLPLNVFRTTRTAANACILVSQYVPHGKFENSISAVAHAKIQGALESYDYLLRTDIDAFLTPAFASWKPAKFTVGRGAYCYDWVPLTCHRLDRIAHDMGLNKNVTMIQNVGSTWYGATDDIIAVANITMSTMDYLDKYEFTTFEKGGEMKLKDSWPDWHHGVLTMYAGQIAVNYIRAEERGGFEKRADMLDFASSSDANTSEHAHVHTWPNGLAFSKRVFSRGGYDNINITDLDLGIIKDYAMYIALTSEKRTE